MAARRLLRSLTAKAIGLLLLVLLGLTATVGSFVWRRVLATSKAELDRRGVALLELLERHRDLQQAMAAGDRASAEEILRRTLAAHDEVAYLAALDRNGNILAAAVHTGEPGAVAAELVHHGMGDGEAAEARSDGRMRRFTQPVVAAVGTEPRQPRILLGQLLLGIRADRATRVLAAYSLPVLICAVVLVLALLGFFLVLQQRAQKMVAFAEQLAQGNLTARLTVDSSDELGRLASALLDLRGSTLSVLEELHEAADSLASSSNEVLEAAEQQLSRAGRQADTVKQTGSAVSGLRAMSQQATAKAEAVVELAKGAEVSSSSGDFAVQQSASAMRAMREQVEAVSETLERLVQQTHHIGSIIAVVTDLAQQSNMVALNANIEAVRAGEAGKGFALVAKEVRSLSDLSRRSTDQVRSILDEIASAAADTTRVVQEGRRRADSGVELAHAAGKAIRQLSEAISQSSNAAGAIAGSIRQQGFGVEQIGTAIEEIDRDARESTRGIGILRHASQDIKSHSDRMQAIVQRYRLPGDPER